jgi:hypothetical protein
MLSISEMVPATTSVYSSSSTAPPGVSEYTRAWAGFCCRDPHPCSIHPPIEFLGQLLLQLPDLPHLK